MRWSKKISREGKGVVKMGAVVSTTTIVKNEGKGSTALGLGLQYKLMCSKEKSKPIY